MLIAVGQTCAESQIFHEKSSQVTQKSSHDFDFFEKKKKVKVMTMTDKKNFLTIFVDFLSTNNSKKTYVFYHLHSGLTNFKSLSQLFLLYVYKGKNIFWISLLYRKKVKKTLLTLFFLLERDINSYFCL
jgi:hypothetical protein